MFISPCGNQSETETAMQWDMLADNEGWLFCLKFFQCWCGSPVKVQTLWAERHDTMACHSEWITYPCVGASSENEEGASTGMGHPPKTPNAACRMPFNTFEATPGCPTSNAGPRTGSRKSTVYPWVNHVEPTGRAVLNLERKTRPMLEVAPVSARVKKLSPESFQDAFKCRSLLQKLWRNTAFPRLQEFLWSAERDGSLGAPVLPTDACTFRRSSKSRDPGVFGCVPQTNEPPATSVPLALVDERIPAPDAYSAREKRKPRGSFVTHVVGVLEALTALLQASCWPCPVSCWS